MKAKQRCPLLDLMKTHALHYIDNGEGPDTIIAIVRDRSTRGLPLEDVLLELDVFALPCNKEENP